MQLKQITQAMERIAPLRWAESWDNVGLLIEPPEGVEINQLMLTIDLTEAVLEEALAAGTQMIIAYHPPIFAPLKRLTHSDVKQRIVLRAIAAGLGVYVPHTALDAAPGGVNDFLAEAVGAGQAEPITTVLADPATGPYKQVQLVTFVPRENADALREIMTEAGAGWIGNYSHCSFNLEGTGTFLGREGTNPTIGQQGNLERVEEIRMEMLCPAAIVREVARKMCAAHPYEEPAYHIVPLAETPDQANEGVGQGRFVTLNQPTTMRALTDRLKQQLSLDHVRIAQSTGHDGDAEVRTVALCAGAGGSVLKGQAADVYLTGEMRHHDVLEAVAHGTSVILCEHTNTERPYLKILRDKLTAELGESVTITLSQKDADPLRVS